MPAMSWFEKWFVHSFLWRGIARRYVSFAARRISNCKNVLEIGCGNGTTTRILARLVKSNITGVDVDKDEIKLAKLQNYNIKYVTGDASNLPFMNGEFDAVCEFLSLHHIPKWKKVIQESYRVLRPQGEILFLDIGAFLTVPMFHGDIHLKLDEVINEVRKKFRILEVKGNNFAFFIHARKYK